MYKLIGPGQRYLCSTSPIAWQKPWQDDACGAQNTKAFMCTNAMLRPGHKDNDCRKEHPNAQAHWQTYLALRPSTTSGSCLSAKKACAAATAACRQAGSLTLRGVPKGVMWGGARPNEVWGTIGRSLFGQQQFTKECSSLDDRRYSSCAGLTGATIQGYQV